MFRIQHRRRREERTDFGQRLAQLKSGEARVVIRRSLYGVNVQFIKYKKEGDQVVCVAGSSDLKKLGWKAPIGNLPAAYLIGMIAGAKAKKAGVSSAIADMGLYRSTKGSRLYATLKGVIDAGVNVPHSKEIFPSDERIKGKHIADYASAADKAMFSKYSAAGVKPQDIAKHFEEVKMKIK
ncbi:MAG TPA: 50S ribosomal protein L18 [archaeon]|nr:50S ribosomal protein L18 [archaeon]